MVDRVVRVQLVGDSSSLVRAANEAASALRGIGGSAGNAGSQASSGANQAQSAWEKFKSSVAGQVAIGDLISKGVEGGFGLIKDGFKQVIEQGMSYEQNMNTLQAVTSASASEMEALGARAKQLGNDVTIPGASAGTAAEAMKELAKGGLDVKESMAAAAGTLRLAAAAQVDGGRAAEIQANALNAFRLGADQADHVADLLANAANAASGEVTDMASSLQQSATVAAGFGISIDETTTTLALFAKNGLLGSDAGTSFKTMLTALASPTEAQSAALAELGVKIYDARGQFVGMETVTDQLAKAHQRMTVEQYNAAASTAFGTDAIRAANILGQEASAGFEDMAGKVSKAGGAQELAAAQSQGFTGALDRLSNAGSTVALELYEKLAPALTQVADFGATAFGWLGDAVGWMGELPAPVWAGVTAFGAMILLKGPLNTLFLQAIAGYTRMALAVRGASFSFAGIATTARAAMAAIGGPFGLAVIGITTALSLFSSSSDDAAQSTEGLNDAIDEQTGKLKGNAAQLIATEAANSGASAAYERIGGKVSDYVDALGGVPEAQARVNAKLAEAKAAYDAHQAAIQAASQGTAGFTGAQAAAGAAAGQAVPAIDDLNKATGYLSSAQGTLSQRTDDVRLANEGATGALGATAGAASGAGSAAVTAAEAFKAYADNLKVAQDNAQTLADNTALAQFLGAAKGAADDANRSMSYFKQLQDELTGHTRSYNDAVADQNASLSSLKKAFEDGTKAATENTDAGNLNVQALNDWDVAALTATTDGQSMYDQLTRLADGHLGTANAAFQQALAEGKSLPDAMAIGRSNADSNRQAFIDLAMQYNGGNREAAENLANKLGILAGQQIEDKNFQVIADDKQAQAALAAAQAATIADKTFRITALAGIDQASLDAANAKAAAFGYATTDYAAIKNQKADGGWITGPGGPRDDKVRARLSPGEFVVNAAQAQKHAGLLEAINAGAMGFADGGRVPGGKAASAGAAVAVSAPDADVFRDAWQAIADAAKDAWAQKIKPVMDAFSAENTSLGDGTSDLVSDQVEPAWRRIIAAVTGGSQVAQQQQVQLQSVTSAQWAAMAAAQQASYSAAQAGAYRPWADWSVRLGDAQGKLAGTTASQWSAISGSVVDAQKGKITPAFDTLNSGSDGVGNRFSALAGTSQAQWQAIAGTVDSAKSGTILPAIDAIGQAAGGLESAFGSAASGIASKWSEIKPGVADPVNWLLGSVWNTGIVGAWDKIKGWLPSISTSLGPLDLVGYATGGPVQGSGTDTSDNILARLSPGEWVVPAAATRQHLDLLKAITPGFATGGPVGWDRVPSLSAAFGGPDQAMPDEMTAFVKAFVANPFDTISDLIGEPLVRASQFDHGLPEAMSQAAGEAVGGMIGTLKDMFGLENDGKGGPPKLDGSGTVAMDGVLFVDGEAYALPSGTRGEFLKAVASKMGTSYVWGAAGPDVFDCSGLMSWALAQAGAGVGRMTADAFHKGFPHVGMPGKPGDLATFSARYSKESGMAGHIGAILDTAKGLMMHTDGAGPARVSDYRGREGGPLSIVDVLGGGAAAAMAQIGELPAIIARVIYGDYGTAAGVGAIDPKDAANFSSWESTRTLDTLNPIQDFGAKNMARGDMSMVGPLPPGDPVNRWAPLAASAFAAKGLGTENVPNLIRQIGVESGGNPLAYNDYDRNYTGGHPSKGLLQTIPSTFAAHAAPGYGTNIWHPPSNFMSAIDYAWGKYGSFPGRAYEKGGVLPPGFTMAYNGTGQNEFTFTRDQLAAAGTSSVQIDYDRLASAVGQRSITPGDITAAMQGMTFQLENGGDSIRMIARGAAAARAGMQSRVDRVNGGR